MNADFLNGKVIRHGQDTYRIVAHQLKNRVLVTLDCVCGPSRGSSIVDLMASRSPTANDLRNRVQMGLVS